MCFIQTRHFLNFHCQKIRIYFDLQLDLSKFSKIYKSMLNNRLNIKRYLFKSMQKTYFISEELALKFRSNKNLNYKIIHHHKSLYSKACVVSIFHPLFNSWTFFNSKWREKTGMLYFNLNDKDSQKNHKWISL